jgi:hypothetical protein
VGRRRDDLDAYSRGVDRDTGRRRSNSRSSARDKDTVAPANENQVDQPDRSGKPEKPSKPKQAAASQEPMIIVHVNDRLGTKAAIPCLASDPVGLSHSPSYCFFPTDLRQDFLRHRLLRELGVSLMRSC